MRVPLRIALALVALGAALALAQDGAEEAAPFAGLQVIAHGDQVFDLATGVTTLPQGGEVVDRNSDLRLVGETLRYKDGAFIEAEGARVEGRFGAASAARLRIDVAARVLEAEGELKVEREGLRLEADGLLYDAEAEVVRFHGNVRADAPDFEAAAAVLDLRSGAIVLVGPYRFADGPFTLRAPAEGALLELVPAEGDAGTDYAAASEVSPELAARLEPFLP